MMIKKYLLKSLRLKKIFTIDETILFPPILLRIAPFRPSITIESLSLSLSFFCVWKRGKTHLRTNNTNISLSTASKRDSLISLRRRCFMQRACTKGGGNMTSCFFAPGQQLPPCWIRGYCCIVTGKFINGGMV